MRATLFKRVIGKLLPSSRRSCNLFRLAVRFELGAPAMLRVAKPLIQLKSRRLANTFDTRRFGVSREDSVHPFKSNCQSEGIPGYPGSARHVVGSPYSAPIEDFLEERI